MCQNGMGGMGGHSRSDHRGCILNSRKKKSNLEYGVFKACTRSEKLTMENSRLEETLQKKLNIDIPCSDTRWLREVNVLGQNIMCIIPKKAQFNMIMEWQ